MEVYKNPTLMIMVILTLSACNLENIRQKPTYTQNTLSSTQLAKFHYNNNIDWCLSYGKNCGIATAHKICEIEGFDHAVKFKTRTVHSTKLYFTGEICPKNRGDRCDTFTEILCGKSVAPGQGNYPYDSYKYIR